MTCLTGSTALVAACCTARLAPAPAARADDAAPSITAAPSSTIRPERSVAPAGA